MANDRSINELMNRQLLTGTTAAIAQTQSLPNHHAVTQFLTKTKQLHAPAFTAGLVSSLDSPILSPVIGDSSSRCGRDVVAGRLFDEMPTRNAFYYNNRMKLCMNNGAYQDVLRVFVEMLHSRYCLPDSYTYPFVIKACGELGLLGLGRVVQGRILVAAFGSDIYVQNSLLAMYMNCGEMEGARRAFDTMEERCVVSWNTMVGGYFKNGCATTALMVFKRMVDLRVEIDSASVVSVLPACGCLKHLEMGRRVHVLVEEKGFGKNVAVRNALVDMYAKCGSIGEATMVFDRTVGRDVVSWTSMINGYVLNDDVEGALGLCRMMQMEGTRPNSVTIVSLLSACASLNHLKDGRCLHGWALRRNLDSEVIVETSLIDMYAKCNRIDLSIGVFRRTSRKRTVPWNALLSGCIHNGLATEAIGFFKQMLTEGVQPNDATLTSLLPAYAFLADLQVAKNVHCFLMRSGSLAGIEVATCLIDIYSKCGSLESAHKIFDAIPSDAKDIFVWSVIIAGYGMHGHGETAVSLFREMVQSGVKPNEITFTSVLHACSHAGLAGEGLYLFKFMHKNQQIVPSDDHYTCIVDLLGRAGQLDDAYDLIRTMPFTPSHAVWGALLGSCVIHQNVELGEIAAQWLFKLEPENTGNYVLLAKLYGAVGRWTDAENVRHSMNDIGLRKEPALSLIDVRNT